jgi:CcmD family protein
MNFFVAAYIIIWLLLMGYIFYLGQRQNKLRKGIEFLQNLLDKEKDAK